VRLAVLDQGREPVALCPASGCDSGRGRGGGASGGPSGVPCLGRGISEDRIPQESSGATFLVGGCTVEPALFFLRCAVVEAISEAWQDTC
jgi:hypothetical protein